MAAPSSDLLLKHALALFDKHHEYLRVFKFEREAYEDYFSPVLVTYTQRQGYNPWPRFKLSDKSEISIKSVRLYTPFLHYMS